MSKLWIKLWVDILHDFKIVDLPEFIQLRFIKLLLLAAEFDDNGRLPSVKHIAHGFEFSGQKTVERTLETLSALKQAGVIDENQQGWFVVNWNKRQAPADPTAAERQRRYRERNITRDVTRIPSTSTSSSDSLNQESLKKEEAQEDSLENWIHEFTGFPIPPTQENIKALDAMEAIGTTKADIEGAVAWFSSVQKVARTPAQLLESVKFQVGKRTQSRAKAGAAEPASFQALREYAERLNDGG